MITRMGQQEAATTAKYRHLVGSDIYYSAVFFEKDDVPYETPIFLKEHVEKEAIDTLALYIRTCVNGERPLTNEIVAASIQEAERFYRGEK